MSGDYDWKTFYRALCERGPGLLTKIEPDLREYVAGEARSSDAFWSEDLESLLALGAAEGDLQQGVKLALERWRDNVVEHLEQFSSLEIDTTAIGLELDEEILQELVAAARPGQ